MDIFEGRTLNGIDLRRVIPLTGANYIRGTTTFRYLEVTEMLRVFYI